MYVAPVETELRSAPSASTPGSEGSSDFFAELLRRHREVNEPAPRPCADAERQTGQAVRERSAAPARAETRAETRTEGEAGKPVEPKTEARVEPEPAAIASPATRQPVRASNPRPADHSADAPATVAPAAIDAPQLVAALPPTPVTVAIADGDAPVQSAPANGTIPAAGGAVPTAAPDLNQAGTSAQAATPAVPDAPAPTRAPAQAAPAAALAEPVPDDAAADPLSKMPSPAPVTEVIEAGTKPGQIPAPAQALGKLGSGAEIALSAQAAGETPRPAPSGQASGQTRSQAAGSRTAGQGDAVSKASDQPTANLATGMVQRPSPAAASPSNIATPSGTESFGDLPAGLDPAPGSGPADQLASGAPGNFADLALRAAGRHVAGTVAAAAAQLPAADQVAVQIQRAVRDGASRIIVQLSPAELGRVEVQLDFTQDGRVSAAVLADRADTLDMLQRDARLLERSLQEAGLKTDGGSLSFDLRDGGRNSQWSQGTGSDNRPSERVTAAPGRAATVETAEARPRAVMRNDGGVDIRV